MPQGSRHCTQLHENFRYRIHEQFRRTVNAPQEEATIRAVFTMWSFLEDCVSIANTKKCPMTHENRPNATRAPDNLRKRSELWL